MSRAHRTPSTGVQRFFTWSTCRFSSETQSCARPLQSRCAYFRHLRCRPPVVPQTQGSHAQRVRGVLLPRRRGVRELRRQQACMHGSPPRTRHCDNSCLRSQEASGCSGILAKWRAKRAGQYSSRESGLFQPPVAHGDMPFDRCIFE